MSRSSNKFMKYYIRPIIFVIIWFILITLGLYVILPPLFYKKIKDNIEINCNINPYHSNIISGDGYVIINNILDENCRQKLVNTFLDEARFNKNLNEDRNLTFYSNETFINQLSNIIGKKLYPVNSLDLQRCWLRYYFEGMKAQYYEKPHHDVKSYDSNIKQYRLLIPIFDTSDTKFTIDKYGEFSFRQNMGVFLEAENCLHKVTFTKGERLILYMDFITKECDSLEGHYNCRGIKGYSKWIYNTIWRKISSIYYKLSNNNY